jgi:hypothetical protein
MVGFVVVGSMIGMPARRFFPHAWRDSTSAAAGDLAKKDGKGRQKLCNLDNVYPPVTEQPL